MEPFSPEKSPGSAASYAAGLAAPEADINRPALMRIRRRVEIAKRLQEQQDRRRMEYFRRARNIKAHLIIDTLADLEPTPSRRLLKCRELEYRMRVSSQAVGSGLRFRPQPIAATRRFGHSMPRGVLTQVNRAAAGI